MTQSVDLLEPRFLATLPTLPPSQMARVVGASLALLAVATIGLVLAGWHARRSISGLEAESSRRAAQAQALEDKLGAHLDRGALAARLSALDREFATKERLVELLSDSSHSNDDGFSEHLLGLSRRWSHGVWLTGIEIDAGGAVLAIRGSALRPELIPQLLQRLGEEAAYHGTQFDSFLLVRSETRADAVDFEISNRPSDEAS